MRELNLVGIACAAMISLVSVSGAFAKSAEECRTESFTKYPRGTLSKSSNARETFIAGCMKGQVVPVSLKGKEDSCRMSRSSGWGSGSGSGTMSLRAGQSCVGELYVAQGIPAKGVRVTAQPRGGNVSASGNRFTYTARSGFSGRDTFSVQGEGVGPDGKFYTLRGTVTADVN